jgi:FAD-dependent urate hydroxylase
MNQKPEKKALIIGCGIAGPILAMFLKRVGIEPVVYEGRPDPNDEAGYFLNLAPNGVAVLDALGIKDEVLAHGTLTTSIAFLNHRGKRLGQNPETTILLKRGLLNRALREAAIRHGVTVRFGKRLSNIDITRERAVIARFEDGSEVEGDFLIGCDGVHSRTRRSAMPDAPKPRYTGVIGSGGFTRAAEVPPSNGVMWLTFGREGFFGYQVTPSGEAYWFETFQEPGEPDRKELEAIPNDQWRQQLLDVHRHYHAPIADIIGSTESR